MKWYYCVFLLLVGCSPVNRIKTKTVTDIDSSHISVKSAVNTSDAKATTTTVAETKKAATIKIEFLPGVDSFKNDTHPKKTELTIGASVIKSTQPVKSVTINGEDVTKQITTATTEKQTASQQNDSTNNQFKKHTAGEVKEKKYSPLAAVMFILFILLLIGIGIYLTRKNIL